MFSVDVVLNWCVCVLLQELIGKMLQVNAEVRYSAQDILRHPWVTVRLGLVCVGQRFLIGKAIAPPHRVCVCVCVCAQRQKHTRAKGKTAPKKYNVAPDITRRGETNAPRISLI